MTDLNTPQNGPKSGSTPMVTIVVPCYNEHQNLPHLFARLTPVLDAAKEYQFEVLVIDNGSTDSSHAVYTQFCEKDRRLKFVRFSRNFGIEASFFAGAEYAKGDALIYLFSDLQDPPELIPEFLKKWKQGYQVVYGVLQKRSDQSLIKSWGAYWAYRLIFRLSEVDIPVNATDFRLLSRPVINSLKRCRERTRYMRGLTHWIGFKQTGIPFERSPRLHGVSNAGIWWCVKYAIQAMIAFSPKPLQMASLVGIVTTGMSILGAVLYIIHTLLTRAGWTYTIAPPPGWTTLLLTIFFFGGIQCLFLGILGEYLAQVQKESKGRPVWIVDESSESEFLS